LAQDEIDGSDPRIAKGGIAKDQPLAQTEPGHERQLKAQTVMDRL